MTRSPASALPRGLPLGFLIAAALSTMGSARAQCPVGTEILVDYDVPGSGYSEQSENWTSWATSPCNGASYRYLSHTVGDGTRRGSATFQPAISHAGHWQFRTGYRATENRTSDADFFAYDDEGGQTHTVVDQRGDGCQWVDLGVHYCVPGGSCRVVLDGTDDSQSDCADVTIFRLVDCAEPPDGGVPDGGAAGRCDGIRAVAAYEVCEETATSCAGVFADGSGCVAYCAAAGMTCVARYGGEPGCQQESDYPIPCDENNGHGSDWCECEGPPIVPDAGTGGVAGSGGAVGGGFGGAAGGGGSPGVGGVGALAPAPPSGGQAGSAVAATASASDEAGCGCRAHGGQRGRAAGGGLAFSLGVVLLRRAGRRGVAARRPS